MDEKLARFGNIQTLKRVTLDLSQVSGFKREHIWNCQFWTAEPAWGFICDMILPMSGRAGVEKIRAGTQWPSCNRRHSAQHTYKCEWA